MGGVVSVVVPCFNEAGNIERLVREVVAHLPTGYDYEIVLVDDGSTDGTLDAICRCAETEPRLRWLSFSRNFGHQAALRAGMREATGDCVITMDADLQHPPELLPVLIEAWADGHDIVYTRRRDGGAGVGPVKRLASRWFYRVLRAISDLSIEQGTADFRLVDRKVVEVINGLSEPDVFLRGFIAWCGFRAHAIDYLPAARHSGRSKYSLGVMLAFAFHGMTQFSIKPLRAANVLGFLSALVGTAYGGYAVWAHFGAHHTTSGWTSVVVSVLIIGGVQLIVLGIIGEYLGRTFIQTKGRPDYIVSSRFPEHR